MNRNNRLAVMASLAAVSNFAADFASATTCSSAITSYNACTTASCQQSYLASYPECFATSSSSTTSAQISATSVQQITTISNAVSGRLLALGFSGPPKKTAAASTTTGLAAGGSASAYNVWGSLSEARNSYAGNNTVGNVDKASSTVTNSVLGFDYGFAPNMVVGLSAAFDRGTGSVGAAAVSSGTHGTTYAPYFGWQFAKDLALDVSAGWGDGKYASGVTTANTTRSFTAVNLSYNTWMDNLQLVGKAGYLTAKESYSDSTTAGGAAASSNKLGQFRIGGEVGYWMNGVMPFAGLSYTTDSRSQSSSGGIADTSKLGKSAFLMSIGANFFSLASGVTGGIAYNQETGRSNGKNSSLSANVSFRF